MAGVNNGGNDEIENFNVVRDKFSSKIGLDERVKNGTQLSFKS